MSARLAETSASLYAIEPHRLDLEGSSFELLPLTALDLTAAAEDEGSVKRGALASACGLSVVEHASVNRPEECFVGGGVGDSSSHRFAILDEARESLANMIKDDESQG